MQARTRVDPQLNNVCAPRHSAAPTRACAPRTRLAAATSALPALAAEARRAAAEVRAGAVPHAAALAVLAQTLPPELANAARAWVEHCALLGVPRAPVDAALADALVFAELAAESASSAEAESASAPRFPCPAALTPVRWAVPCPHIDTSGAALRVRALDANLDTCGAGLVRALETRGGAGARWVAACRAAGVSERALEDAACALAPALTCVAATAPVAWPCAQRVADDDWHECTPACAAQSGRT